MVVVKHDAIVPYIEIGELYVIAYVEKSYENVCLTIARKDSSRKIVVLHEESYSRPALISLLNAKPVEKALGLERKLTNEEKSKLNASKADIINYLRELEHSYACSG
ncbi:MAG: hypothetical protein QW063_00625 [Candidatus Nanoarchaeia archaeon]